MVLLSSGVIALLPFLTFRMTASSSNLSPFDKSFIISILAGRKEHCGEGERHDFSYQLQLSDSRVFNSNTGHENRVHSTLISFAAPSQQITAVSQSEVLVLSRT